MLSTDDLIRTWRQIIAGADKSWVVFEHGTCVILTQPEADITAQAVAILREWGPVHAGTSSADFNVVELGEHNGWVVPCHHPDIFTYVAPDDMSDESGGEPPNNLIVGLLGRSRRDQDAAELHVIYRACDKD